MGDLTPAEGLYPFRAVGMNFQAWKRVVRALRDEAKTRDSVAETPHTMSDESRRSYRTDATTLRALADEIERQL